MIFPEHATMQCYSEQSGTVENIRPIIRFVKKKCCSCTQLYNAIVTNAFGNEIAFVGAKILTTLRKRDEL